MNNNPKFDNYEGLNQNGLIHCGIDAGAKAHRRMNQQTGKAPLVAEAGKKNPDVIVTQANQTVLFEPQNRTTSEWLHCRCGLVADKISGDTEIQVHPSRCKRIIEELKVAGFEVVVL
jgi:hypothetical protein